MASAALVHIMEGTVRERMITLMRKQGSQTKRLGVNPLRELWQNKFLYLLVLPAVVYTFIFCYLTLPYIAIAFEKFNYKTGIFSEFVGLKNFQYFFASSWAWTITRNTLIINILFLVVGTIVEIKKILPKITNGCLMIFLIFMPTPSL